MYKIKLKIMKITEIREKYHDYKISYMSKKDYLVGTTKLMKKFFNDHKYEDIFIASKENKFWILYIDTGFMTGHFNSKKEAVEFFRKGGR